MKHEISRNALYDLAWQTPMVKLALQFGLSGNALAKLCRRVGIQVPECGYWAKLQHGKRMKRPPMKPSQSATETLTIEGSPSSRSSLESGMPEPLAKLIKAERAFPQPIAVPKSPKPHYLVDSWPVLTGLNHAEGTSLPCSFGKSNDAAEAYPPTSISRTTVTGSMLHCTWQSKQSGEEMSASDRKLRAVMLRKGYAGNAKSMSVANGRPVRRC